MGSGLLVILGFSGGVNGVDQLRLDVVPDWPKWADWSSAFSHVVLDYFYHSFPSVTGGTETQSLDSSFSPPCLRVSSVASGAIFIFFYIVKM